MNIYTRGRWIRFNPAHERTFQNLRWRARSIFDFLAFGSFKRTRSLTKHPAPTVLCTFSSKMAAISFSLAVDSCPFTGPYLVSWTHPQLKPKPQSHSPHRTWRLAILALRTSSSPSWCTVFGICRSSRRGSFSVDESTCQAARKMIMPKRLYSLFTIETQTAPDQGPWNFPVQQDLASQPGGGGIAWQ